MTKYRGYWIDHVEFNSKKDIDDWLRKDRIIHLRRLLNMMRGHGAGDPGYVNSCMAMIMGVESALHDEDGLSWAEIEALEADGEGVE